MSCCLSFLCAFWWPPRACEFANSLEQYWHSYFLLSPVAVAVAKEDESGVLQEDDLREYVVAIRSSSSETLKPNSFNREDVVVELCFVS